MNDVQTTPKKIQLTSENIVTPMQSPKPSTSGLHRAFICHRQVIHSSGSESDTETNIKQQITQPALNKSALPIDHIYSFEEKIEDRDSFGSDDNIPLISLKAKKFTSSFQELLPTPNYAVTKNKPKRKVINYRGQRVTKDLFKDQATLKENKKNATILKNCKRKPKETEKKTKDKKRNDFIVIKEK